jgi:hypothetical protein
VAAGPAGQAANEGGERQGADEERAAPVGRAVVDDTLDEFLTEGIYGAPSQDLDVLPSGVAGAAGRGVRADEVRGLAGGLDPHAEARAAADELVADHGAGHRAAGLIE